MNETLVVNLFAGPGTGKSTLSAGLFYELKLRMVAVELVREFAKDVVWEGREHLFDQQIYIFAKQLKRMHDLRGKVSVIVTDSPILLSNLYGERLSPAFKELVAEESARFDNVNVLLRRTSRPYVQAGRVQTEEKARELDQKMEGIIAAAGQEVHLELDADRAGLERLVLHVVQSHLDAPA